MREIKFRGKRLDNGEWVYGSFLSIEDTYFIIEQVDFDFDYRTEHNAFWFDSTEKEVDPATVGQYTGLKDKNGKDIYEGDVMEIPETEFNAEIIGRVLFEEDAYYIIPLRGGHLWGLHWSLRKHDAKIIGNIHDNPELLKGGEK